MSLDADKRYIGKLLGTDAERSLRGATKRPAGTGKLTVLDRPATTSYTFSAIVAVGSTAIVAGDYLFFDSVGNPRPWKVKPASDEPWGGDLGTTQADFLNHFAGIALAGGSAGDTITVDGDPFTLRDLACTSETHEVGDGLGPAKNAVLNKLVSNLLVKAAISSSICRCMERDSSASATVAVRLGASTAFYPWNFQGLQ